MRVALDANVLVSGLLVDLGPSGRLMDLAADAAIELVIPSVVLDEAALALRKPRVKDRYGLKEGRIRRYIGDLREGATVAPVGSQPDEVPADPTDNHVFAVAVQERYDIIVSGDDHLLRLGSYESIPVLSPRQALDRIAGRHSG